MRGLSALARLMRARAFARSPSAQQHHGVLALQDPVVRIASHGRLELVARLFESAAVAVGAPAQRRRAQPGLALEPLQLGNRLGVAAGEQVARSRAPAAPRRGW